VPGSGAIDWGIGLYPPGHAFTSKSGVHPGGIAFDAPVGATESMNVTISQPGLYTVVVWKNRPADLGNTGTMTLLFDRQTTGVPDPGRPLGNRLIQGVRPNPVIGPATVEVELTAASNVVLSIFDPRGRRVSRTESGSLEPGRHELAWDGRDDSGDTVPAGIYFVRVVAGNQADERKIVRVR
ncbi:MAG TPA: FlgD immunoglobulin-like domain containing protein, partial [Candidatus Eisenbacteria bacterium]